MHPTDQLLYAAWGRVSQTRRPHASKKREQDMTSEKIRTTALEMLGQTIPQADAIRFTFMQVIAMIEREGFEIPQDGEAFLSGRVALRRIH